MEAKRTLTLRVQARFTGDTEVNKLVRPRKYSRRGASAPNNRLRMHVWVNGLFS